MGNLCTLKLQLSPSVPEASPSLRYQQDHFLPSYPHLSAESHMDETVAVHSAVCVA